MLIRGFPNKATNRIEDPISLSEYIGLRGERGELKHLSNLRNRKKTRFPQQRRAKGKQPKPDVCQAVERCAFGVVGVSMWKSTISQRVTKAIFSGVYWKVGPQRVIVPYTKRIALFTDHPSNTGHVKPGVNQGGPPPKAKYYQTTDSELSKATEK